MTILQQVCHQGHHVLLHLSSTLSPAAPDPCTCVAGVSREPRHHRAASKRERERERERKEREERVRARETAGGGRVMLGHLGRRVIEGTLGISITRSGNILRTSSRPASTAVPWSASRITKDESSSASSSLASRPRQSHSLEVC